MSEVTNCKCCRELTVYEEIDALAIEEKTKERILSKLSEENSNYINVRNELYECRYEIERLEKAVICLSKMVAK